MQPPKKVQYSASDGSKCHISYMTAFFVVVGKLLGWDISHIKRKMKKIGCERDQCVQEEGKKGWCKKFFGCTF